MDFKEIIKRHLDNMAQQDAAFAERYKADGKTLDKCINYITSQARKQAKGGGAYVEDAVVYGWAVHYYQEDDKDLDLPKTKVSAKVGHMDGIEPKDVAMTKQISKKKAIVKDKRDDKVKELDLFGDF
jgi:hypothetical protein